MKLLPAVIMRPTRQAEKVERMVRYCRELDGTELTVIDIDPKIDPVPHPIGAELAIRQAMKQFYDEPWIYLEADSPPIKPGWRYALSEEYAMIERPFLMASLAGADYHDVASGIGVYPAHALDMLPPQCDKPPYWDFWLLKERKNDVYQTPLIQHRYGFYSGTHVTRRCEFPRDRNILRPETVIFHADPTQSIIRGGLLQTYYHSGDLGDIIAALPIIKQQGGGHLIIGPSHHNVHGQFPRQSLQGERYNSLVTLLRKQSYIKSLRWVDKFEPVDKDLSTFRKMGRKHNENLAEWQGRFVGRLELDLSPWLEVDAPAHERVIISRSARYHNPNFPWQEIIQKYGSRALFIGLPAEHKAFEELVRRKVEHAKTRNLSEVATLIEGAEIGYYNQSSPFWIAAGLGKPLVQETWAQEPNSIVRRDNATYVFSKYDLALLKEKLQ